MERAGNEEKWDRGKGRDVQMEKEVDRRVTFVFFLADASMTLLGRDAGTSKQRKGEKGRSRKGGKRGE